MIGHVTNIRCFIIARCLYSLNWLFCSQRDWYNFGWNNKSSRRLKTHKIIQKKEFFSSFSKLVTRSIVEMFSEIIKLFYSILLTPLLRFFLLISNWNYTVQINIIICNDFREFQTKACFELVNRELILQLFTWISASYLAMCKVEINKTKLI